MKKKNKLIVVILITLLLELSVFNFRFFLIEFSNLENCVIEDIKLLNKSEEQTINDVKKYKNYKVEINQKINSVKLNFSKVSNKNINIDIKFVDNGEKYVNKEYKNIEYNKNFNNSEYFYLNSQNECLEINFTMESTEDFELENIEINTWYYEFNLFRVFIIILISAIIIYWENINEFFNKRKKLQIAIYIVIITIITILLRNILCKISK